MADDPFTVIDQIADQTGKADNIIYHFDGDMSDKAKVAEMLFRYNVNQVKT